MSRDIRSYFNSSNQKTNNIKDKSRKKVSVIELSDEDESISKDKKTKKSNPNETKKRTKKRNVISSDEDEIEKSSHLKNKKIKGLDESKHSGKTEKLMEVLENPMEILNKKPLKRINATKNTKKVIDKVGEKIPLNGKLDLLNEDDDFNATLSQLDTSQIEDEYLLICNQDSSPHINDKKKSDNDVRQQEKHTSKTHENDKDNQGKSDKNLSHFKHKESKTKEKDNSDKSIKISPNKSHNKFSPKKQENVKEKNSEDVDYNKIIEEKIEKKKQNAILYRNYCNRGGARNPGSKEIPEGAEQCLANLKFIITGVLESLECEEAAALIEKYGGKRVSSVSKKVNYIIVGEEPGPSKISKAQALGIKQISEDDFLNLIRTRPPGVESQKLTSSDNNNKRKRDTSLSNEDSEKSKRNKKDLSPPENSTKLTKLKQTTEDLLTNENEIILNKLTANSCLPIEGKIDELHSSPENSCLIKEKKINESKEPKIESKEVSNKVINNENYPIGHTTALVEKYRPKDLKQIIGQTGEKSNAKKLLNWLINWHKNHGKNSKTTKPKFSYRDDTGAIYKAALLSGPPGIGKTTTAYVICKQLGYEVLEFNASDTRSKKLLQTEISSILSNRTVKSLITNESDSKKEHAKHILLMDEVDGMAGNEDRGGMQELIAFIKATEIPIICICNDRNCQKIKTLANYTFDLRFQKPRLEQIRAAMMSICFKEGIKITPDELSLIIRSTNQDIRQVLNHIAVLSANIEVKPRDKQEITKPHKNLKLGPWDVVRKVFSADEHKNMSIHDKSDLFFHDYNIAGLFVQENYLNVSPVDSKNLLFKIAKTSASLSTADIIENKIRSSQAWNLLPVQACFSSVIPGSIMSGYISSQINFPSWLGKNSKKNKFDRLLQEITIHARVTTGASKEAINLDYLKMLAHSIIRPLAVEGSQGVEKAIEIMNKYHLSRDDLDSLVELVKWPNTRDLMESIDTKTKTAFTRAYNKSALFSSTNSIKKKSYNKDEDFFGSDEEEESEEENDKIENDKLIKAKVSKTKTTQSGNKGKSTVKNSSVRPKKK